MRVLVTGGAGYIGSHACKALAGAGRVPITYDNLISGHEWAVKWGPLEKGDILDGLRLESVLREWRPEAVMHFAACIDVNESVADPAKYYRNNLAGALSLLNAMLACGIRQFIFSSTAAVYGMPDTALIGENHRKEPINPYGQSKLMIERVLEDYTRSYGLSATALRYFNAAGADPDGELGEEHDPETHLIPLVLQAAAGRRRCITVFGDDYDTPDGTCIRDYVHVSDLADAHVIALHALPQEARFSAYNLGTGRGYSVREVISTASEVTQVRIPQKIGERRPGDASVLVADANRARRELGWQPQLSDLESLVGSAWRWMSANSATRPHDCA